MFTVKSSDEFISEVRALSDQLKNIRLSQIEISKENRKIVYHFICDNVISEELKNAILEKALSITMPVFTTVEISVKKIVSNDELINIEIFKYLQDNYPSISIFLKQTDVISTVVGDIVKYTLRLTKDGVEYVRKNGAIQKLNSYLSKKFCSDFAGSTDEKELAESVSLLSEEVYADELQKIEHRTIKVKEVYVIDDVSIGSLALYLEDAVAGQVTVCGKITDIQERQTKTGKPFLIIHIDDTTARISGIYFSKKNTYAKIKELQVGDAIIARGSIDEYNGRKSFTFEKINRCTFPEDFIKKDRYKKSVPRDYKLIFPTKTEIVKLSSIFDDTSALPSDLTEKTYVVFDLETTGLDVRNNGITEIGAVKIVKGKICEQWTTLVKPDYKITEENQAITGISEEMVKDAPKISSVMPDFIKFIDGAVLVAHNADFDMSFVRRFANAEDYEVKNQVVDSVSLARECLPMLKKHDLHTVAEHFGIIFNHHRALDDAIATAQAFIEMMKIKNN